MGNEDLHPSEDGEEIETLTMERLPESLGFIESQTMIEVKESLARALANEYEQPTLRRLGGLYLALGEKIIDDTPKGANVTRMQMGLNLAKISARKKAVLVLSEASTEQQGTPADALARKQELLHEYIEDLEEALQTTTATGLQYLESVIDTEINWAIAELAAN